MTDKNEKKSHIPVLLQEVLQQFEPMHEGVYIDTTFGAGGYSEAILEASPNTNVLAFDRDHTVEKFANKLKEKYKDRFEFCQSSYDQIESYIKSHKVVGVVYDLGVSSMQLDDKSRGFSFDKDERLDMRMDTDQKLSAYNVVNDYEEEALADVIYHYGDERKSRAIARKIVWHRDNEGPIETTKQLADIVAQVLRKYYKGHSKTNPATRTFQAIRIEVNDELNQLKQSLAQAAKVLEPGGRMVCVTFHSGEDRIVKQFFNKLTGAATPDDMEFDPLSQKYVQKKQAPSQFKKLTKKVVKPSDDEVSSNPRARSAKLRSIEKLGGVK